MRMWWAHKSSVCLLFTTVQMKREVTIQTHSYSTIVYVTVTTTW